MRPVLHGSALRNRLRGLAQERRQFGYQPLLHTNHLPM